MPFVIAAASSNANCLFCIQCERIIGAQKLLLSFERTLEIIDGSFVLLLKGEQPPKVIQCSQHDFC